MANQLDQQKLGVVFKSRPDILEGIQKAANSPSSIGLFNSIADFIYEQIGDPSSEPAAKRRRVDIEPSRNGNATNGTTVASSEDIAKEKLLLEVKDISVSIPQRKKFDICFTAQHVYGRVSGTTGPAAGVAYAWKDIEYAFYLPVPEKTQLQYNYVLFPKGSYFPSKDANGPAPEPFVFTVASGAPKPGAIGGPNASAAAAVSDSYSTLFHWAINKCLQASSNQVQIVAADPDKFHSMVRQPHRPGDRAVHVKAFRGSKDGYLFFLENGILWGFKKPLMFIPLDRIAAVSYTSVLQRTFNIVVEVFTGGADPEETEELEFGMLDQEDYPGINETYVMKHGLQDRSMADQRKAKRELAENAKGKKGGEEAGAEAGAVGEDGMTELQRAQMEAEQQLDDDEDEDEEDYDPGSDGESEGSGSSDDDDDDDDDDEDDAEGGEMDEDEGGDEEEEEGGEEE